MNIFDYRLYKENVPFVRHLKTLVTIILCELDAIRGGVCFLSTLIWLHLLQILPSPRRNCKSNVIGALQNGVKVQSPKCLFMQAVVNDTYMKCVSINYILQQFQY